MVTRRRSTTKGDDVEEEKETKEEEPEKSKKSACGNAREAQEAGRRAERDGGMKGSGEGKTRKK